MPGLFYQPISRKTFLKTTLKAAGLTVLTMQSSLWPGLEARPQETRWALLSDTHIPEDIQNEYRGYFPFQNLRKVVPEVERINPLGVMINGDVARLSGELGDYEKVQQLLTPVARKVPIYMTMGNHDDRENFYKIFEKSGANEKQVKDKHVIIVEVEPVRMILLDSLLYVNKVPGLLGKDQRTWLDSYLEQSDDKPTLLFVHHTLGDGDSDLLDVDRLFHIVKPHQKVKAIFYGHSHQYKYDQLEGIHLINQPAVGYNFSDDQPVGWLEAIFTKEGADFQLHAFAGNTKNDKKTTSVQWR